MPATLILGGDRLAFTLARLLCSSGERVYLMGSVQKTKAIMTELLQSDVERDHPFQLIDDLRNQEHYLKKRLENIQFCNRMEEVGRDLKAVVVTDNSNELNVHNFGSVPVANFQEDCSSVSNCIDVKAYQPLELTKMAQILVQPSTDPTALSCIRTLLENAGISEITSEQASTANEMMENSKNKGFEGSVSNMNNIIFSLFPQRKPIDHTHSIMH